MDANEIFEQMEFPYVANTDGVAVAVNPIFLEDESEPEDNQFVWAYFIRIANNSGKQIQLIDRHWRITNALGTTEDVTGPGVVGEQPILQPGDIFEYNSYTVLDTASGIMQGDYGMVTPEGADIKVAVPPFSLDQPDSIVSIN